MLSHSQKSSLLKIVGGQHNDKEKYDVHGTVPVVVHITVEAESEEQAIKIATKKFKGVHEYLGNGGCDKLIGVEGDNESITVDGNAKYYDCTEH